MFEIQDRTHLGLAMVTNPGGGTELSKVATCCFTTPGLSAAARSLIARSLLLWRSQVQEGSFQDIPLSAGDFLISGNAGGLSLDDSLSSEPAER